MTHSRKNTQNSMRIPFKNLPSPQLRHEIISMKNIQFDQEINTLYNDTKI